MTDELQNELKLQFLDELTDTLHIHQQHGPAAAETAFERILADYHQVFRYDPILLSVVTMFAAFLRKKVAMTIYEVAELIGEADIEIAA